LTIEEGGIAVRRKWQVFVMVALAAALMLTAGCAPRWSAGATRYAITSYLYDAADVYGTPKMVAADGYTFLVVETELAYGGQSLADIRQELIFAVYDYSTVPATKYGNFYNGNPGWELFDDIMKVYGKGASDEGSVFFHMPSDVDIPDCVFKVMRADYEVLYEVPVRNLVEVIDYPASW